LIALRKSCIHINLRTSSTRIIHRSPHQSRTILTEQLVVFAARIPSRKDDLSQHFRNRQKMRRRERPRLILREIFLPRHLFNVSNQTVIRTMQPSGIHRCVVLQVSTDVALVQ
jgi:hypothetical protein